MRLLFAALLGVGLVAPLHVADETERIERTVACPVDGTLKLRNWSGDVRITGVDRSDVAIIAVRRGPRERLSKIALGIEAVSSGVVVDANKRGNDRDERNHVVNTEFDIQVPRATNLDVSAFSSAIRVEGVAGSLTVETRSGDIWISGAQRRLKAHTFSGVIDATLVDRLTNPDIDVDTYNGDVRLRMPQVVAADLSFSSYSGDIESDYPLLLRSKSARSLRARLTPPGVDAAGPGSMRFKTFSGDVRITRH